MTNGNHALNNTFGLNVKFPTKTFEQSQSSALNALGTVWQPLFNFIDNNQNIFTGNIASEIEKYNLMTYNIGAALRANSTNGGFDVKG